MKRKGWYLVAYDIANPRRLSKVHNLLKKEGIAVQRSLFFVHGTEPWLNRLLDRIAELMALREDDLKAYPITDPRDVWTNGPNPLADFPVLHFGMEKKKLGDNNRERNKVGMWKRVLGMLRMP